MSSKGGAASSAKEVAGPSLISSFLTAYSVTPKRVQVIDRFLLAVLATGLIQFFYCSLVGTFPFNSFLSGFISCVGVFVLTVSLRLQVNNDTFKQLSEQRAFADYVLCNLILFLVVMNFMG